MRITGGEYGSLRLKVPGDQVRPTKDRVRASIFSALGERVIGARVLDLFAGTGALGLEALSRGAESAVFVERDSRVSRVLDQNIQHVLSSASARARVVRTDVYKLAGLPGNGFDLVFADPPYDDQPGNPVLQKTLLLCARETMLKPAGLLVFEQREHTEIPGLPGWELVKHKKYGQTAVLWLRQAFPS